MKKIFPNVSSLRVLEGVYTRKASSEAFKVYFNNLDKKVMECFKFHFEDVNDINKADLIFDFDNTIKEQGYHLNINNSKVVIKYRDEAGAFYGVGTFSQILENSVINNLEIIDEPKIKIRGLMLDISRDKVPLVKSIKFIIDYMAYLKMNHLELYIEGFSFEYKSFPQYLEKDGFITINEYKDLESYASKRFIDLVPNENGFGHMAKWLEKDEFKSLAVCPGGMSIWGRHRNPSTLNPLDERSLDLVKKMYADMLPISNSKYFNMNFDEPFELGHGLSEGMDKGRLYLDFAKKAYEEVKKYNKIPLIWGDVLIRHPDLWDELPKDMIFLDWGYDANYKFDKHAKELKEKNISFICAPGTSSWCSFLGRFNDWHETIRNSVDSVYKYDGEGVILTDWGDFGHLQSIAISYPAITYMGLYSWTMDEESIINVEKCINEYWGDESNLFGSILTDLNNYSRYEPDYCGNGTRSFHIFMWASVSIAEGKKENIEPLTYFKNKTKGTYLDEKRFNILNDYVDRVHIDDVNSKCEDVKLSCMDLHQSIKLLKMIWCLSVASNEDVCLKKRIEYIKYIFDNKDEFLLRQEELWMKRNKSGGFASSKQYIENFIEFARLTQSNLLKRGEQ